MVIVDTSVWIEHFRRESSLDLMALVPRREIAICLPVLQEVLQGARDEDYTRVRETLLATTVVENPLGQAVFEEAVALYRSARRAGSTIRSPNDCLIAARALRHDLEVLHRDRDYPALAKVSALRQRPV